MLISLVLLITLSLVYCYQKHNNRYNIKSSLLSLSLSLSSLSSSIPQEDKLNAKKFHHVELYCGDATNTYKRFMLGLGKLIVIIII